MKYCILKILITLFLYSGLQAQNTEYWILQDTYALKKDGTNFSSFGINGLEYNGGWGTRIGEYIVNDSLYYIAESNNVLNRIRQPMLGWTDTFDAQLKTNPWFLGFNYSDTVLMVTEKESRLTSISRQSILQCSYIWNRGDNNKGEIFKTVVIDSGPVFPAYEPISEGYGSFITPIRMADNENWWIITYKFSRPTTTFPNIPISCKLIVYGLTKDSIWENAQFDLINQMPNLPITTALPEIDYIAGSYQSVFNYNTNIVYLINEDIVLYRFDFSRSNGTIIGFIRDTLPGYSFQWNPYTNFPVMDVWTFTISPNGNYLYTFGVDSCRQFNLSAQNPLLDMTIIPELCWEGYNDPTYLNYITYPYGVMSKDGKIFVFPVESVNSNVQWLNRSSYIARISNPDLPYPACGIDTLFYDTGVKLATGCFMNIVDQYAWSPTNVSDIISVSKITLFPNPAQTEATLTWSGMQESTFVLRDMLGRTLLQQELNTSSGSIKMNLSEFSKGIYLWQVRSKEHTQNGKLVVE